ncbi:hypothetical protein M409DRAFT_60306 [Zasmidium cellare ATCC 36951]|uniref:Uncharacterized protein n=1 Tax=Zasmidium cellare ATCC 36951 TaxID=1080233 RepID=A0A6A6C1A0_ZASCE|nr:uncharacterized protein M409DRAFT_60306 [Zasmidium cellare ATCC 36951]KAF2160048.1 hypothetical protein M409DRAFT_60306 [Zasmidium cellare ATCC 36951]
METEHIHPLLLHSQAVFLLPEDTGSAGGGWATNYQPRKGEILSTHTISPSKPPKARGEPSIRRGGRFIENIFQCDRMCIHLVLFIASCRPPMTISPAIFIHIHIVAMYPSLACIHLPRHVHPTVFPYHSPCQINLTALLPFPVSPSRHPPTSYGVMTTRVVVITFCSNTTSPALVMGSVRTNVVISVFVARVVSAASCMTRSLLVDEGAVGVRKAMDTMHQSRVRTAAMIKAPMAPCSQTGDQLRSRMAGCWNLRLTLLATRVALLSGHVRLAEVHKGRATLEAMAAGALLLVAGGWDPVVGHDGRGHAGMHARRRQGVLLHHDALLGLASRREGGERRRRRGCIAFEGEAIKGLVSFACLSCGAGRCSRPSAWTCIAEAVGEWPAHGQRSLGPSCVLGVATLPQTTGGVLVLCFSDTSEMGAPDTGCANNFSTLQPACFGNILCAEMLPHRTP